MTAMIALREGRLRGSRMANDPEYDDGFWQAQVEIAHGFIREMEKRTTGAPEPIAPQSQLAGDDTGVLGLAVSTLAWQGLQSSVDHLAQIADLMEVLESSIRPYAPFTLTRAALLAAGETVWLLSGVTHQDRIRRATQIQIDDWTKYQQYLQDLKSDRFLTPQHSSYDALIGELAVLIAKAKRTQPGPFVLTDVLREVAVTLTQKDPDDPLRHAILREWRLGSAAAHSRSWSLNVRPGVDSEDDDHRSLVATPEEIGSSIVTATKVAQEAFRLWDEMRA